MKYVITLIVMSFVFTGCFAKKTDETVNEPTPNVPVQEDVSTETTEELPETETQDVEESNDAGDTQTPVETAETDNTQEEESPEQSEQEIIEEYEDDLEALFDDLLGSDDK